MADMLGLERFGCGFLFIENLLVFVLKKRIFFFGAGSRGGGSVGVGGPTKWGQGGGLTGPIGWEPLGVLEIHSAGVTPTSEQGTKKKNEILFSSLPQKNTTIRVAHS